MLDKYKKLLQRYHKEINQSGWAEKLPMLIKEMDAVWGKLTIPQRNATLEYADQLYQNRIK